MMEGEADKSRETPQGEETPVAEDDFESLFQQSLQAVKPGGVVTGKVVDAASAA